MVTGSAIRQNHRVARETKAGAQVTEQPSHTTIKGVRFPTLHYGAASATGPHRAHNEDAYVTCPPVFAVADGMGGHQAGEVASKIVVDRFCELAESEVIEQAEVIACLAACRSDIGKIPTTGRAFSHPGTTVVAITQTIEADSPYWLLTYLGDSRAYQWTPAEFELLSHDHSIVQELVDAGQLTEAEARTHRLRHVVTRSIDAIEETPADYALVPMVGGSRILLCSDGINNELTDGQIEVVLARPDEPQAIADALVDAAVAAGGHDNATAVVIDVGGIESQHVTLRRREVSEWPPMPQNHVPRRSLP